MRSCRIFLVSQPNRSRSCVHQRSSPEQSVRTDKPTYQSQSSRRHKLDSHAMRQEPRECSMSELRFDDRVAVITGAGQGAGSRLCAAARIQGREGRRQRSGCEPERRGRRCRSCARGRAGDQGCRRRGGRLHRVRGDAGRRQGDHRSRARQLRSDRHPHPQRRNRSPRFA